MNNNWLKEKQNSALGKILFNNGYYDFHKELFYSKDEYGFNPDIVFMGKIHFDFEDFDTEYMNDIKHNKIYLFKQNSLCSTRIYIFL